MLVARNQSTQKAPKPQSKHDRCNDHGHGLDVYAVKGEQCPLPYDLVKKRREAGKKIDYHQGSGLVSEVARGLASEARATAAAVNASIVPPPVE